MDKDLKSPEFDQLLTAYRAAIPDIDGGADFMPGLWSRIDANRAFNRRFRLWTHGMLTAALGCCLAMGAFLFTQNAPYSDYLEVLEADNRVAPEGNFQPVNFEPASPANAGSNDPWVVVEDE